MGRLIYSVVCSLDGYLADENGDFSWAFPLNQRVRLSLIESTTFDGGALGLTYRVLRDA